MKAEKDKVIGFDYSLTVDGEKVESSFDNGEALWVLLGHGQLIPGLESALEGQEAGATLSVDIEPEQGYGERRDGMTQRVPKKYFQQAAKLKPGMTTVLALKEGGHRAVVVQKVGMTTVDVDLNHPMAGKSLHFDVTVNAVRDASAEELEHGHAHPPGAEAH
ncbi:FKBP-type peptidyl-prolyl cis-trans isomerase [Frateuria aurantia]